MRVAGRPQLPRPTAAPAPSRPAWRIRYRAMPRPVTAIVYGEPGDTRPHLPRDIERDLIGAPEPCMPGERGVSVDAAPVAPAPIAWTAEGWRD